jgi:hypothetical protein
MANQHRGAPGTSAPTERKGDREGGADRGVAPKPGDAEPAGPATLLQDGNRPHETILHGTELEDFGLDVLPLIQPHKA